MTSTCTCGQCIACRADARERMIEHRWGIYNSHDKACRCENCTARKADRKRREKARRQWPT